MFRRHPSQIAQDSRRGWLRALVAFSLAGLAGMMAASALAQSADPPALLESWKKAWDTPEPWRTDRFYIQTSVATVHFHSDPKHNDTQHLVYGEWRLPYRFLAGQVLVGASFFDNSYGQPTEFVFGGLLWRPIEKAQEFYVKVGAGVVHGYKGEYQNKIPWNSSGYAPGIVPAVGYCYNRFCGEMIVFGGAGMLWTFGMTVP
jgi:hypothetical protein